MITEWTISNFKSIRQKTTLDFSPLTIFAGANSSGKSAFLQSILLVAQTLAHKVTSRSVVLNGAFALLGQFDDLRSADSEVGQIAIGWKLQPPQDYQTHDPYYHFLPHLVPRRKSSRDTLSSVSCEIAFDAEDSGEHNEITQVQPRLVSSQLSIISSSGERSRPSYIKINLATDRNRREKQEWLEAFDSDEARATSLRYDVKLSGNDFRGWLKPTYGKLVAADLKLVGCQPKHFLPQGFFWGKDKVTEDVQTILNHFLPLRCSYSFGDYGRHFGFDDLDTIEITVPVAIVNFILDLARGVDADTYKYFSKRLQSDTEPGVSLKQLSQAMRPHMFRPKPKLQGKDFLHLRDIDRKLEEYGQKELEKRVDESVRKERNKKEPRVVSSPLPPNFIEATKYLEDFFSTKVRYLGPLRDEPKPLYPLPSTVDPYDVGLKGEHTASVLELHKSRLIKYIPAFAFSGEEIKLGPKECSLEAAVVDWLQYLDVAEDVKSEDKGKLGHELTVQIAGTKRQHDLTHVGVGVSQVLPILVASLLAEPDTTLVFEQPELHLHPKVQTLLADFFLSITQLGKQCVLETHSEYLINRIRYRVATAATNDLWGEAVKMYFVERPQEGSTFKEVKVNEYGAVIDWPKGFFDQSQKEAEAILMAAMRKRRAKQEK